MSLSIAYYVYMQTNYKADRPREEKPTFCHVNLSVVGWVNLSVAITSDLRYTYRNRRLSYLKGSLVRESIHNKVVALRELRAMGSNF